MKPSLLNAELNRPILDAILTDMNSLTALIRPDGIIELASPSITLHLGIPQQCFKSNSLFHFVFPDDADHLRHIIHTAQTALMPTQTECRFIHRDGSTVYFDMQCIPLSSSSTDPIRLLCIGHNITKHIHTADMLRHNLQQYRLVGEYTTDLIRILSKDHTTLYASSSYRALLGYEPEELIGRSGLFLLHPDDFKIIHEKFREMKQTRMPVKAEFRYKHKNAHFISLEGSMIPTFDETGELDQVILVSRDITMRKLAEKAMANTEKLSVIGQLAAGVAHEIRNPLTSIKGFIQLLKTEATKNNHYFEVMLAELDRINFIVSELLVLAKPKGADFTDKNLHEIISHVITLLNTQAIMNNVQITADFDERVVNVRCVENHLKQVFLNLLKNSIEAMPSGGRITIITELLDPCSILIRFTDTGRGIPEELIARLGEPFFTTKEKGSGLGLMVSHKIIKDHQGEIKITSDVNKGTQVDIILPVLTKTGQQD